MALRSRLFVLLLILTVGGVAAGCTSTPLPPLFQSDSGTVSQPVALAPTAEATATAEPTALPTPTSPPTATPTTRPTQAVQATPTSVARAAATATATEVGRTQAAAQPASTPTPSWPAELVVTEADVEAMAGTAAVEGLTVQELDVEFGSGSMTVSADSLRYGFLSVKDLVVSGKPVVSNGQVSFQVDSMKPNNLVTAAIPSVINQILAQSFADWYVESIRVEPGQMVLSVRPG